MSEAVVDAEGLSWGDLMCLEPSMVGVDHFLRGSVVSLVYGDRKCAGTFFWDVWLTGAVLGKILSFACVLHTAIYSSRQIEALLSSSSRAHTKVFALILPKFCITLG
jgi:hypothetical protein